MEKLIKTYENYAYVCGRPFFWSGGDVQDFRQEALIGLYKAIRDYRPREQSSFKAFASMCVQRQLTTALKTATRKKHSPLNRATSLETPIVADDGSRKLHDLIPDMAPSQDDLIKTGELAALLRAAIMASGLSGVEAAALESYMRGDTYAETAVKLNRLSKKSCDNALQRVKRKLDVSIRDALSEYLSPDNRP